MLISKYFPLYGIQFLPCLFYYRHPLLFWVCFTFLNIVLRFQKPRYWTFPLFVFITGSRKFFSELFLCFLVAKLLTLRSTSSYFILDLGPRNGGVYFCNNALNWKQNEIIATSVKCSTQWSAMWAFSQSGRNSEAANSPDYKICST